MMSSSAVLFRTAWFSFAHFDQMSSKQTFKTGSFLLDQLLSFIYRHFPKNCTLAWPMVTTSAYPTVSLLNRKFLFCILSLSDFVSCCHTQMWLKYWLCCHSLFTQVSTDLNFDLLQNFHLFS